MARPSRQVNIMTLHSAKGLEFDTVFLPGWEEGLFPHQRSLDESGRNGLEEERRLAHVGLTRARKRAKIYFATNRRIHGMWTTTVPSRFLDELPEAHVVVKEPTGGSGGFGMSGYGASHFDEMNSFGSKYTTPRLAARAAAQGARAGSMRRASRGARGGFAENGQPRYVPDGVFDNSQDTEANSDHLSPGGRGRAAGAGEGEGPRGPPSAPPR